MCAVVPTLPPDVRLRDVGVGDAAALARILIAATDAAFRGLVPPRCLAFTEAESAANWRRLLRDGMPLGDVFLLADAPAGVPVGYAWGGPCEDDPVHGGELRQIQVWPAAQRRGIGRLLVREVAARLAARGIAGMRVDVLCINLNRAFYERLGARYLSERAFDWEGVVLPMCRYGWADLAPLLGD
jgi:ribosomal protein S18 acetylase RimI-like enzyme